MAALNVRHTQLLEEAGEPAGEEAAKLDSPHADTEPGLPWLQVAVLICATMSDGIVSCVLYPFVPYMLEDFGLPVDSIGVYVGLLGSSYNLAQFVSGVQWGRASDVWGRRPILMIGLVSQALTTIAFGLSTNLVQAMAWRCVGGLLNGTSGVGRAAMRDITNERNRTRGFALLGTAYGFGFVIGPTMGGLLSRPAELFPLLFKGTWFETYPYLLPCAASTVGCYLGLACMWCCGANTGAAAGGGRGCCGRAPIVGGRGGGAVELVAVGEAAAPCADASPPSSPPARARRAPLARRARALWAHAAPSAARAAARRFGDSLGAGVSMTIGVQFCLHFVVNAMQELFPLFCANARHGLGLRPAELGSALAPLGLSLLVWPLLFPLADRAFGTVACFRFGVCVFLLVQAAIPALTLAQAAGPAALWAGLTAVSVLRGVAGVSAFTTISVIMNNLLGEGDVGYVNGVASSITALARAIAPTLMGSLFAACAGSELPFPLDFHLPFYVLSLLCALTLALSTRFGEERRGGRDAAQEGAGAPAAALAAAEPAGEVAVNHNDDDADGARVDTAARLLQTRAADEAEESEAMVARV